MTKLCINCICFICNCIILSTDDCGNVSISSSLFALNGTWLSSWSSLMSMGSPLLLSLFPDAWVISDITISCGVATHHTGHEQMSYPWQWRRYNSSDKLYKGDVENEDLDNRLSNIESGRRMGNIWYYNFIGNVIFPSYRLFMNILCHAFFIILMWLRTENPCLHVLQISNAVYAEFDQTI
jgi:hypothetical protein